jgi:hypothetical protein
LNCSTLAKELLSIFVLWLHPEFGSWDMTMYLVLSTVTSSPISWLATTEASVFLYIMYTSTQYINIFSRNWKVMGTIQFQAILVYLNTPKSIL